MKFEKLLYIILAVLTVATFVVPFVSAYDYATDASPLPAVIAMGIGIFVLIAIAVALASNHPAVSIILAITSIFLVNPMLQVGMTYLTATDNVSINIGVFQQVLSYLCYAQIVYIIIYIIIQIISNLDKAKQAKMEGLD